MQKITTVKTTVSTQWLTLDNIALPELAAPTTTIETTSLYRSDARYHYETRRLKIEAQAIIERLKTWLISRYAVPSEIRLRIALEPFGELRVEGKCEKFTIIAVQHDSQDHATTDWIPEIESLTTGWVPEIKSSTAHFKVSTFDIVWLKKVIGERMAEEMKHYQQYPDEREERENVKRQLDATLLEMKENKKRNLENDNMNDDLINRKTDKRFWACPEDWESNNAL